MWLFIVILFLFSRHNVVEMLGQWKVYKNAMAATAVVPQEIW